MEAFEKKLSGYLSQISDDLKTNNQRRKLYCNLEILRLDVEVFQLENKSDDIDSKCTKIITSIDENTRKLSLGPADHKIPLQFYPLHLFDQIYRFIGLVVGFFLIGTFISLPIIVLRVFDISQNLSPYEFRSEKLKRSVAKLILMIVGIFVKVEGLSPKTFESNCTVMTFSHASNLDGFLVASTCPIQHSALAKKELFLIPFFSWISLAIGGVPVDRQNRDRAIGALKRTADSAKSRKLCIAIAPEGTRSLTGQLLPFKKGHT